MSKACTKCGTVKPLAEFYKDASMRDGLRSGCKACAKARRADYYAAHPEEAKAYSAKWQAAHPEKVRANSAKWHAANPERAKANHAKWKADNPEASRIHCRNRRARKLANGGRLSPGLIDKLFKLQRGKCACCHVSIDDGNHLDHVIPVALGGPNEDWNMQLLCAPCNLSKGARHPIDFMQQRGFLL